MGASVTNVMVQSYENTVRHLAQQSGSRFRPWTMEKSVQSEGHNWERIGQATATKKTTRKQATPDNDTPWSRRKSIPVTYDVGDVVEPEDIVQVLIDPKSSYAAAHAKSMRRAYDDEIIAAATGDSRDGAGNVVAFTAGQTVGDGSASISFDIVTEVTEKFLDNDIDCEEEKVFAISPRQCRKLLQLTEAVSGDYNTLKPLQTGKIVFWMGFFWVVSTRLLAPAAGQVDCFAMTRSALGLQVNKDIWAECQQDPSISYAYRPYSASSFGCVRVEDEQVVRVHLSQTI